MSSSGQKVLASAFYALGQQRLKVNLLRVKSTREGKPYRVHVRHTDNGKHLSSGYTGVHDTEDQARETYDWTCQEATKKGWAPGPKRGGGHLRLLAAVPAPISRVSAPPAISQASAPLPSSRLMQKALAATHPTRR